MIATFFAEGHLFDSLKILMCVRGRVCVRACACDLDL